MALLMSLILFLLWIATSEKRFYVLFLVNIINTIIYIVYTSLIYSTVGGYRTISDAIIAFVLGVKKSSHGFATIASAIYSGFITVIINYFGDPKFLSIFI
jgi:hypothetical protein